MACEVNLNNYLSTPDGGEWSVTGGVNNASKECPSETSPPDCIPDDGIANPDSITPTGPDNNLIDVAEKNPGCYNFTYFSKKTTPAFEAKCECGDCATLTLKVLPGPFVESRNDINYCPSDCSPPHPAPEKLGIFSYWDCNVLHNNYGCTISAPPNVCTNNGGVRLGPSGNGIKPCNFVYNALTGQTLTGGTTVSGNIIVDFGDYSAVLNTDNGAYQNCDRNDMLIVEYNVTLTFSSSVAGYYTTNSGILSTCEFFEDNPGINQLNVTLTVTTNRTNPGPACTAECTRSSTFSIIRQAAPDPGTFSAANPICNC